MTKDEAIIQLRLGPGINEDVSEKYNDAVNMAIDALKREPCVIRCEKNLAKEDFEAIEKRIHEENQNVVVIPYEAEVVSTNTSTNTSTKPTNISTNTSIETPQDKTRGKWIIKHGNYCGVLIKEYFCDQCGERGGLSRMLYDPEPLPNFCGHCGADMRGGEDD